MGTGVGKAVGMYVGVGGTGKNGVGVAVASGATLASTPSGSVVACWGFAGSAFARIEPTVTGEMHPRMSEGMRIIQSNRFRRVIMAVF